MTAYECNAANFTGHSTVWSHERSGRYIGRYYAGFSTQRISQHGALKTESRHVAHFVVTGGTGVCHNQEDSGIFAAHRTSNMEALQTGGCHNYNPSITNERQHGGTAEEGNCSYLLPLSHRDGIIANPQNSPFSVRGSHVMPKPFQAQPHGMYGWPAVYCTSYRKQ